MKTLCLLRHAKADRAKAGQDAPALSDHDRPLVPRGVAAAGLVGRSFKQHALHPHLVLCSTARRATETARLILAELDAPPPVESERGLYLCGAQALLKRLNEAPDSVDTLMLVAHNPDVHILSVALAAHGDKTLRGALQDKFPTGACAVVTFDTACWRAVASGEGRLTAFILPRTLV